MAGESSEAKVVRMGVIGVGGMGQGHCRGITEKVPEARLTAVCDIDPVTAEKVGTQYNVPHFVDYRDLIRAKLCDAVSIATPHPVRPPIAIGAMKAKLHVLSEKPLSERVSTADQMLRAAKAAGVVFAVMFQRRTEPIWAKAIEVAKSGQLGRILRTTMISPEFRSQAYYDSGSWRATWSGEGGGVMMNQSPHILDLFVQVGGMPSSVRGRCEIRMHHIEVEDLAEALLTYPDGGSGYLYCSTTEAGPGQMIEIYGTKGKLCCRNGVLTLYRFETPVDEFCRTSTAMWAGPKAEEVALELPTLETGHHAVIRNFARCILFGEKLVSPGEDGLQSLELANAVWLSASKDGKPVSLPLNRKAYDAFLAKKRRESTFVKNVKEERRETDTVKRV